MPRPDDLRFALQLADAADAISGPAFTGRPLPYATKPDGSPVTAVDLAVERELVRTIAAARPGDAVLGEEVGAVGAAGRTWLLDGIDGTVNFVAGRRSWATEIALLVEGVPVLGVSSSPGLGRRWWGGPELGAWTAELAGDRGHQPEVLAVAAGQTAVTSMPGRERLRAAPEARWLGPLEAWGDVVTSPLHGALVVAAGEGAACLHVRGGPWDFAAFAAIVTGAGGRWSDLEGAARLDHGGPVVYSNGTVHDALLAALRRA